MLLEYQTLVFYHIFRGISRLRDYVHEAARSFMLKSILESRMELLK